MFIYEYQEYFGKENWLWIEVYPKKRYQRNDFSWGIDDFSA